MTLIALASLKAAPGVTTTALALGVTWPRPVRVVAAELDPAGGDLAVWYGLPVTPGLASLAPAARRETGAASELALAHGQLLPCGLEGLVGPMAAEQAGGALAMLPRRLLADLDQDPEVLWLADCGRLAPTSPAMAVAAHARLVVLVARPVTAELSHLAATVAGLRSRCRALGLVLAGDGPYEAAEIGAALGVPLLGALPADQRAAIALAGVHSVSRRLLRRSPLLRGARDLAVSLSRHLGADVAGRPPARDDGGPTTEPMTEPMTELASPPARATASAVPAWPGRSA